MILTQSHAKMQEQLQPSNRKPPPPKHPIYGNGVAKGCFTSLCDKLFYFVRSQTIFSDLNFHALLYQLTLGDNFFDQECIDDYLLHG
jgi:hypothetical protein